VQHWSRLLQLHQKDVCFSLGGSSGSGSGNTSTSSSGDFDGRLAL
jgi:hypothetical protein